MDSLPIEVPPRPEEAAYGFILRALVANGANVRELMALTRGSARRQMAPSDAHLFAALNRRVGGDKISLACHSGVLVFYRPLDDDAVLVVTLGQRNAVKACCLNGRDRHFDCSLAVRILSDRAPQMPKPHLVYSIAPADRRFPAIQLRMQFGLESSWLRRAVSAKVARRKDESRYHSSWMDEIRSSDRRLRRP